MAFVGVGVIGAAGVTGVVAVIVAVVVLVVAGDSTSQSPARKITEPGIVRIGLSASKNIRFTMYQTETPIRKIPNLFSGRMSILQSLAVLLSVSMRTPKKDYEIRI